MSTFEFPDKFAALASATDMKAPSSAPAEVQSDSPHPSTTDYDMFHLVAGNRPVKPNSVFALTRDIMKNNLLHIRPIDVTVDMGVIDGQHRLAVARELGVPIYYRVVQGLDESHTISLNQRQKNWSNTDYLHYWTVQGRPDYQALTDFCQRNPTLHISNAVLIMQGRGEAAFHLFKAGTWAAKGRMGAQEIANVIKQIAQETRFAQANGTRFVRALVHCLTEVKGLDKQQFVSKLTKPGVLVECANWPQYATLFQELYNHGLSQENRLKFK